MLVAVESPKAQPTELMLALAADHMLASTIFLDVNATPRAGLFEEEVVKGVEGIELSKVFDVD